MLRFAPTMMAVLLCGSVLAGCATTDIARLTGSHTETAKAKKDTETAQTSMPTDLDGGLRQAQLQRTSGHYDDAIHTLSQLMLVASDDPRVVSEYGKALAQKGRAQDAVDFLSRAIELSSNDWTLYSALGVSYDQLGDQDKARSAYEHALALHPGEASVLNNYALSRMLAGDTDGARLLIGRAEAAGGASNAKIAANIAMLNKLAPTPAIAVAQAPRAAQPQMAQQAPMPVSMPARPIAQAMPRPILPPQAPQQMAAAPMPSGVVMQAVPFDPLAGPVKSSDAPIKLHMPAAAKTAQTAKPKDAPKPVAATPAPAKTAQAKPAQPQAKPQPVKAASKDAIPALRMSANAY